MQKLHKILLYISNLFIFNRNNCSLINYFDKTLKNIFILSSNRIVHCKIVQRMDHYAKITRTAVFLAKDTQRDFFP